MAAFLARALDLPAATKDYFNDDNSNSLEPTINAAAQAGLTGGCGDNRYCPSGRRHPRADGRIHAASLQARLSPDGRVDHTGTHRTTPYQSRTGPSSGCPPLTVRAYGLEPVTEAVLRFVRRRSATTLLAFLLLATSAIPASAANPTADPATAPALGGARIAPTEQPTTEQDDAGLRSSIHWEEVQTHANDKIDFAAGRPGDRAVPSPRA